MIQRKTVATPVRQHWSYHSSTSSHQYNHGNMATYDDNYSEACNQGRARLKQNGIGSDNGFMPNRQQVTD